MKTIYGEDDNVVRAKSKSLRGKFDEMRITEGENMVQYCTTIKEVVNVIRGAKGKIEDEIIISKVLITLLHIYVIRVFAIQELRCTPSNVITLEGVIGRIITFEMSNFDNYTPNTIESIILNYNWFLARKQKETCEK